MPNVIFYLGYFTIGTVQLFACWAGAQVWFDIGPILGFIFGIFLAYIPIIGTLLGIYGAITAWDWSLFNTILLFFGPFVIAGIYCIFAAVFWNER